MPYRNAQQVVNCCLLRVVQPIGLRNAARL
jgi:hypothetical protein